MEQEETLTTQRFDITIVWSGEDRLTEQDIREALAKSVQEIDPEATVNVEEIAQPAH